jgi:hypothetical protein
VKVLRTACCSLCAAQVQLKQQDASNPMAMYANMPGADLPPGWMKVQAVTTLRRPTELSATELASNALIEEQIKIIPSKMQAAARRFFAAQQAENAAHQTPVVVDLGICDACQESAEVVGFFNLVQRRALEASGASLASLLGEMYTEGPPEETLEASPAEKHVAIRGHYAGDVVVIPNTQNPVTHRFDIFRDYKGRGFFALSGRVQDCYALIPADSGGLAQGTLTGEEQTFVIDALLHGTLEWFRVEGKKANPCAKPDLG